VGTHLDDVSQPVFSRGLEHDVEDHTSGLRQVPERGEPAAANRGLEPGPCHESSASLLEVCIQAGSSPTGKDVRMPPNTRGSPAVLDPRCAALYRQS
jgi:hypothetical protein